MLKGEKMIEELVRKTRTVRRFLEARTLKSDLLYGLIDLARLSGSARNGQVLKYMVITEGKLRAELFPQLGWAGYLSDWPGPVAGERPPAYIICLLDRELLKGKESEAYCDLGIATQSMLMGAAEQGVLGCRIGAFSSNTVHRLLGLDDRYQVLLVIALGYPAETVMLEDMGLESDIRYWRDEKEGHHVPKRSLAEILVEPSSLQVNDDGT
jgi:nitroreductase